MKKRNAENLVKSNVLNQNLELAYQEMALDEKREKEAIDWAEGTLEMIKCQHNYF